MATSVRQACFSALASALVVVGATVAIDHEQEDRAHRSAIIQVRYPGRFIDDLGGVMRPYVRLEIGSARVIPWVSRDLASFVHDYLAQMGALQEFTDNRPCGVRCLHPLVTLLEKLDAISRRFPRGEPRTRVCSAL